MGDQNEVVQAVLKEYDTLRAESLQSMGNRSQIISFGIGAVGLLIAATLNMKEPSVALRTFMFGVAIPIVSILAYWAWFAEFERMVRAGKVLQLVEERVNTLLCADALRWEMFLERRRLQYPYIAVAALFLGIAVVTPLLIVLPVVPDIDLVTAGHLVLDDNYLPGAWVAWPLTLFAVVHTGFRFLTFNRYQQLYSSSLTSGTTPSQVTPSAPTP